MSNIPYENKYVKADLIYSTDYVKPSFEDGHTVLTDTKLNKKTGKQEERPWSRYARMRVVLHKIYGRCLKIDPNCIKPNAYFKLENCASMLVFKEYPRTGVKRLDSADFCRNRLCPTCNWRKSLKTYSQMQTVSTELIKKFPTARYLFGTFTVRNCTAEELPAVLDQLTSAYKLLVNSGKTNASCKQLKSTLLGYAKALEIVYDSEEFITQERYDKSRTYYKKIGLEVGSPNPNFDMYHPHLHVLFMMSAKYFDGKNYITHQKWTTMWQDCMKTDYSPIVNIKTIKPNKRLDENDQIVKLTDEEWKQKSMSSAMSETLKYPIKPDSLQLENYEEMEDIQKLLVENAVITLSNVLRKRRMITFGGEILKMRKILKQVDAEEDDLIITGDEEETKIEDDFDLVVYNFCSKAGVYIS